MNTLEKIIQVCKAHSLTLELFSSYTRSGVERKKQIHETMFELYYSHGISMSEMLRVLPKSLNLNRCLLRRMLYGFDVDVLTRQYTIEENDLIKKHSGTKTYDEIAEMIGRSREAVKNQANRLGVNYLAVRPEFYRSIIKQNLTPSKRKNGISKSRTLANPTHNG